ncbi:hypothetical protein ABIF90_000655 [Bradyrhizobium japonicum]
MLSGIEYPHWFMLAGAVLVLAGLIGGHSKETDKLPKISCENPLHLKSTNRPSNRRRVPNRVENPARQSA